METFADLCDELRCWETDRLRVERERVLVEQRRLRARELACTRVLDERRALAVELADEDSDARVAASAVRTSPVDLARMAREHRRVSRAESVRRRDRRRVWKRRDDDGFLRGGFELPMEHGGAIVEGFLDQAAERMRPAAGERWASLEHRQADVLIALCELDATAEDAADAMHATPGARVDLHVDVPLDGPALLAGVALPDEWVAAVRADARVHLRVLDGDGFPVVEGRARSFVSDKRRRAVVRRDGRCRWPGCTRRLRLQVHHLTPTSWGGTDDVANLAAVCPHHHQLLVPHGDLVLAGNPNTPDGLELRSLTAQERERRRIEAAA